MASLKDLLVEEGFIRRNSSKNQRSFKSKDRITSEESIALPIYICHNRKSFDFSKRKPEKTSLKPNGSSVLSSKMVGSKTESSKSKSFESEVSRRDEPAIDEVAIRAVISILSGYIERFIKDESFREIMRKKCYSCFERRKKDLDNSIFANMELGIESIERSIEQHGTTKKELKMKTLRNSIRLLSIVASLNSQNSKNGSTCGIPNSHLSACSQLYLSVVYKLEKNDRISARHLLQVFCDSPFLARTHLLPDLWEHFFLPHLIHLKRWYSKEVEFISNSESGERERRKKALSKTYNDQLDMGTTQFALYYKKWLKIGDIAPPLPSVPLPPRSSYGFSGRRPSLESVSSQNSIDKNLYQAVFGPVTKPQSMDLQNGRDGVLTNPWDSEEEEKVCANVDSFKLVSSSQSGTRGHWRLSSQNYDNLKAELWPDIHKSEYFRFLLCQSEPEKSLVHRSRVTKNDIITRETNVLSIYIRNAITTICTSDNLSDCEISIRVVAKAWLDSQGDSIVERTLSKAPVIEGLLEVLFVSKDDEILELAISILAELVSRNEVNRQIILNSDPQLEIFMRLLKHSSLFLKGAILLYLLKPKAKQMLSIEWVLLVFRVLEYGDQMQTLFTIRSSPQEAAFYFLYQLLTGFDVDRNIENAIQVISIGGLSVLIQRLETGGIHERTQAAFLISCCIQADGSCRHYIANNINKASILELIVLGNQWKCKGSALSLLTDLICLNRRTQITKFLNGLKYEGGSLNTMHILLVYLERAPLEQRPLVAAILLQLDLLGDPLQHSVYREEVMDALIEALDCETCNEKVQEQSGRALLLMGGHFSYMGEASMERWLLRKAGFDVISGDSFHSKEIIVDEIMQSNEEEEATEDWLRKAATVLLTSGKKRFLEALSESIANGIPCLARASLVTVAWMSSSLSLIQDSSLHSIACSVLMPRLLETLNYDRSVEERVLASLSLLTLVKNSDCLPLFLPLDQRLMGSLRNLTLVTWTANELLSIATNSLNHQSFELETITS